MSVAHVKIRLNNAIRPELSPVEIEAVVDDSQPYLLLSEPLAARLGLDIVCSRRILDEIGDHEICPYVGPLQVQLGDRLGYSGAVISGSRVRLGFTALAALNPVEVIPTVFLRD